MSHGQGGTHCIGGYHGERGVFHGPGWGHLRRGVIGVGGIFVLFLCYTYTILMRYIDRIASRLFINAGRADMGV
jgi:hypothetical protein